MTEAGASSEEAEDTDDDEADWLQRAMMSFQGVRMSLQGVMMSLQGAMMSLTVTGRRIPGTPTGSTTTGAEAEKNLSDVIVRGIESERKAFTTEGLGITRIDRSKKKTRHRTYPYIIGIPDGIVDFTIGANSYQDALLEIKSTTERTATDIIKDGEVVKTHSRPIYYQVMVMMEILELDHCLVLVTCDDGNTVHSYAVKERDTNSFNTEVLPKLRDFYVGCLLPEIVHPMLSRSEGKHRKKSLGTKWVTLAEE